MAAAHRNITIIPANFGLLTVNYGTPLCIDPQVHGRFTPAMTNGLQFDEGVGQAK